jgi:hypothetical protein
LTFCEQGLRAKRFLQPTFYFILFNIFILFTYTIPN